jgi:hypothetical protein
MKGIVYLFPKAAIVKNRKLSGLKHQKSIISQFEPFLQVNGFSVLCTPWLVNASLQFLPLLSHGILPVSLTLRAYGHIELRPTLHEYDFTLI